MQTEPMKTDHARGLMGSCMKKNITPKLGCNHSCAEPKKTSNNCHTQFNREGQVARKGEESRIMRYLSKSSISDP